MNIKYYLPVLLIFLLGACSSGNLLPKLPKRVSEAVAVDYLIGPGDALMINVWRNEDVSVSAVVRPDGRISTPLVEDMVVIGLKPTEVARKIEASLAKYIRDPRVTVMVTSFAGDPSQQVRVIGNQGQPRAIPYREGMTLLDVMIIVNGLDEFSAGNKTQLIRTVDGKQVQYTVQLDALIRDGDISANRYMQPGDIIIIPEAWF